MTAIISGIIIDTFGEKRDTKNKIEEDNKNKCLICSLGKEEFERAAVNFSKHINSEHNFHQYLWYIMKIKSRQKSKMNHLEIKVSNMMNEGNVNFFPIRKVIIHLFNLFLNFLLKNLKKYLFIIALRLIICFNF